VLDKRVHRIIYFEWEWYWGGFYRRGEEDFSLDVWIDRSDDISNFLDLSVEERIESRILFHQARYEDGLPDRQREFFFEQYWIEPFSSDTGLIWTVENQPQTTSDSQTYRIPVSNSHELKFMFFVRKNRQSGPADPEWMELRWEVARKIMDTVQIEPKPYISSVSDQISGMN